MTNDDNDTKSAAAFSKPAVPELRRATAVVQSSSLDTSVKRLLLNQLEIFARVADAPTLPPPPPPPDAVTVLSALHTAAEAAVQIADPTARHITMQGLSQIIHIAEAHVPIDPPPPPAAPPPAVPPVPAAPPSPAPEDPPTTPQ